MSKLMTTSTWGMSSPLLATSVAMRIGRDLLLNLLREPSRFAWRVEMEVGSHELGELPDDRGRTTGDHLTHLAVQRNSM